MNRFRLSIFALLLGLNSLSAQENAVVKVTADKAQQGNPAAHAFDGDPNTRWAAQGRGCWIQFELKDPMELSRLGIAFSRSERDYAFDIRTSGDGKQWSDPVKFRSEGKSGVQTYAFARVKAKMGRITVYGSDESDWANIQEISVPGISAAPRKPSGGFVITEWAKDPKLANGVAVSFDDKGRAYVAVTTRRKQSSLDIRMMQHLVKNDLSFESVEDRRKFYRENLTDDRKIPDRNKDGRRDWKDLTVQKDAVHQIVDGDGDGRGDTIRTVGEYHSEVTGIAAGVLAVGSDVFVTVEPDFLRYEDKDGDGFPESETLVSTGFQVHMGQGGHNLSGVTLGPDGRVYFSLADKGHKVTTKEGKTYHSPNSGAIFRCELDGSKLERFSTGERNAQELAFDAHGNLFSMDNDGDYPGEKERALYITEGSEHGWRLNWQWLGKQDFIKVSGLKAYNPWMAERLFEPDHDGHAAYLTPTIGNFGPGPCGFTANPGTALSEELSDCFFMTNNQNAVRVFKFLPQGAFFRFEERETIKGGNANTGLSFGPDGALYSASYPGSGAIYRFDVAETDRHPRRSQTREILAGESKGGTDQTLGEWLDHADQRVRLKAQFEFVRRGEEGLDALVEAGLKASLPGRLHAVWGIGQAARRDPELLAKLESFWESDEPEVHAQAAKVVGDCGAASKLFRAELTQCLAHESPRVRFFAAIALGRVGERSATPDIVKFLADGGGESDAYLRHAAVMGLAGTMSADELAGLSTHASRSVRLGAIVALRKKKAGEVRAFLQDGDEIVLLEAARAIHDDQSIPDALPDLATLLENEKLTNEALIRRVINAAFRNGASADLARLERYVASQIGSPSMRRTALASILWWATPPVLDPVEGRYRRHAPREIAPVHAAIKRLESVILADADLSDVLLNGVNQFGHIQWLGGAKVKFADWPAELQSKMLKALAKTNDIELKAFVVDGLASAHASVRQEARGHAEKAGIDVIDLLFAILDDPKPAGQGKALRQLAKSEDPRARKKLEVLIEDYRAGKTPPDWKLELWQAAESRGVELPAAPDRLEFGGDPDRGKKIVMNHPAAQCIRCHQIGKDGSNLGPNLSKIGEQRDRAYLVGAMLEPNRDIAPGYGTVLLSTKSGETVTGVLTKQEKTEWIVTVPDGSQKSIAPETIATHTLVSSMPPVGALLKESEIRDVISYLATLK